MWRSLRGALAVLVLTCALSTFVGADSAVSETLGTDALAAEAPLTDLQHVQTEHAAVRELRDAALSPLLPREARRAALEQLGDLYFYGNESLATRVNGTLALRLYAEAAALGAPRAQFHVGVAHSYGLWGLALDEAAAMTHFYFAALGGDVSAAMALGHRHLLGLGAPKKCESAVRYYELAANEAVARRQEHVSEPAVLDLPPRRLKTVAELQHKKNLPGDAAIVDYYQFSADKGDPDATLNLATLYYYGARGLPQDVVRAAVLFRKAYDLGASGAAYHLGHIYSHGIGVAQDNATAFTFLQEAVDEGNTPAQNELAHMYLQGKGTPRDEERAVGLFKAAAKQGSVEAFYNLGVLHMQSGGSVLATEHPEYEVAHGYFQVAAHQGHTLSSHKLGHMSLHGIGTARSCKSAVESFKLVAERGHWDRVLAQAYRDFKRQDYEAAWIKYAVMAQQGYEVAQHNAAYLLDAGFLSPSPLALALSLSPPAMELDETQVATTAVRLYKLAARQGNVDANLKIGDFYYDGKGGHPVDLHKASAHYSLASKRSNAQAMFNLALMYEHGVGVEQDFFLAKRFYDRARVAHSDAHVPVTLALWKMRAHMALRAWKRWWDELRGNVTPSSASTSGDAGAVSHRGVSAARGTSVDAEESQASVLSLLETWWPRDASSADELLQSALGGWRDVLQSDNFLLLALTVALGVVLYIRSERQQQQQQ